MARVNPGRWTAEIEGDFVVFIIGARLNSPLKAIRSFADLGGRRGMPYMLKHLIQHPDKGLLGYQNFGLTNVQYWRSFEHLEAFAKDPNDPHSAAWRQYWKRVGNSTRSGIWHETFLVRAGEYEAIYGNMPATGLGRAGRLVPISGSTSARKRLHRKAG
ncbi:DUF4188 domain-containing protein [Gordonia rhizosphera]|nr:DUF4188 domain-containing protein [Gordonia rhizosphera]